MKTNSKVIPAAALVSLILISMFMSGFSLSPGSETPPPAQVNVLALEKRDIAGTVTANGMVESQSTTKVYSSLQLQIKSVAVKVGDTVQEGDVLCELNTETLELSIAQQQAAIWAAQSKANYSLAVAQNDLDTVNYNAENGYNTAILQAEAAVKNAEIAVSTASDDLQYARREYREARDDNHSVQGAETEDEMLRRLRLAYEMKQNALTSAQQQLENAEANLKAIKIAAEEQAVSTRQRVRNAELNTNLNDQYIALQRQQKDLEKATILCPVSGVVTAVNATEGAVPASVLFVIEDVNSLQLTANIDEYDIMSVAVGNSVVIKPDAEGSADYHGQVARIAPSAAKTAAGDTVNAGSSSFEADITVTPPSGGLRIGMHAKLDIAVRESKAAFAAPYSAVTKTTAGDSYVLVARRQPDGSCMAEQVIVERGIETNTLVEIKSGELQAGDLIITNLTGVRPGMAVTLP